MDRDELITTLRQVKTLITRVIRELGQSARSPRQPSSSRTKDSRAPKTLPEWILRLRDEGFFKQPKTAKEAHAKIQLLYPCDLNRVEVALLRLQKRKKLRKASKGIGEKKQLAYVW